MKEDEHLRFHARHSHVLAPFGEDYAAPLILLAQTRQADRDKALSAADADHREALARESLERQELAAEQGRQLHGLLQANTWLTEQTRNLAGQLARLTREIHAHVFASSSLDGRPLR